MFIIILLLFVLVSFVFWAMHDLSAPRKRSIQAYHHNWLETSAAQGIRCQSRVIGETSATGEGALPYLVVESVEGGFSERGAALRDQLARRGIVLPDFGKQQQHLLMLHGKAGRKEDLLPLAERYCAIGFRCLLPDLPAHGDSPLRRTAFGAGTEEQELLMALLEKEENSESFSSKPVALGISMGGSYAIQLVGNHGEDFSRIAVLSTFDSLENVVLNRCNRIFLGRGRTLSQLSLFLSKNVYGFDVRKANSAQVVASMTQPLFIAHGTEDRLIPISLGRNLFDSASSLEKKWVEVAHAEHNNILSTRHGLYADLGAFLLGS